MFARLCLYLLVAAPLAASAQQSLLPVILNATESTDHTQVTITGSGFGSKTPQVQLAGVTLAVVSSSNTAIRAALPSGLSPGSYLLTVVNGGTHLLGVFTAAIEPLAGPLGPAGPLGLPGISGPVGASGQTGAAGASGQTGPAGATGTVGPIGPEGTVGSLGATGAAGSQGPAGAAGATGPVGIQGPAGAAGPAGVAGATGTAGRSGPQGPAGMRGEVGLRGATGSSGTQGPAGSQGATGPMGPKGSAGSPNQIVSANFTLQAGASGEASAVGVTNASQIQIPGGRIASVPSTLLFNQQSCTPTNFHATVFGAKNEAQASIYFVRYDRTDLMDTYALYGCTVYANNGNPVSCQPSAPAPLFNVPYYNLVVETNPPADFADASFMVSLTCQ